MPRDSDKSEASFIDIIALLTLLFIGPLAIGGLFSSEYNPPLGIYLIVAIAILYLYLSNKNEKDSSDHLSYQSKYKSRASKPLKYNRKYQPGEEIETNIVGVTFEGRQSVISRLNIGDEVIISRDRKNTHDPNAIRVTVYKYSKTDKEEFEHEINITLESELEELRNKDKDLFNEKKIIYGIPSNEIMIESIDKEIELLEEKQDQISKKKYDLASKKLELVQAGYINKDLAKLIAPIFDQWATGTASGVRGNIIKVTGIDNPNHSKGAIIRFKIPDENHYRSKANREHEIFIY